MAKDAHALAPTPSAGSLPVSLIFVIVVDRKQRSKLATAERGNAVLAAVFCCWSQNR